jgi:hypothetical protein
LFAILCAISAPTGESNNLTCWRAASTDRVVSDCRSRVWARAEDFSQACAWACVQSPCAHHVSLRAKRIVHNVSQACDAQPDRISVFLPWRLGRQEAAAYATRGDRDARNAPRPRHTRGGRDVRYARTIINAHHVSQAWMQSFRALHVPNYTAQALRARGKRAVFLPHAFGLPAVVAGWTWCARLARHWRRRQVKILPRRSVGGFPV